ncbi:uncharacterized protein Z519_06658 [Cladophialophora bantiana CBS 173.52]|uniref:Transcription factor domain-containing protein n=1 Tax=Cladophialophora bantiana (strain ATCC 10958 / CBS 173.52 / CDC B-1940 / NIH 8579) TaxID=1442370 RepID=A0A0D2I7K9_CLAB1|nr:uncharacterized protein Z519_06658 [Cladophialophora bantiana CBS 173.52]KIW92809.1 hypothetical protein Z519_06658 [Cladophialophora bantiana CBS 173.52]
MLELSTSWHNVKDLGIAHLQAVQNVILNCAVESPDGSQPPDFFNEALIYWKMITCVLNENVTLNDYSVQYEPQPSGVATCKCLTLGSVAQIRSHPWTGVASVPQTMFTRVVRLIQEVRIFEQGQLTTRRSGSFPNRPRDFLLSVHMLEEELWSLELPSLHEIANTGDENTPAIHHLLPAETYMFANLNQLYYTSPNLCRRRAKEIIEISEAEGTSDFSWAESQAGLCSALSCSNRNTEKRLMFIGRSILTRLEEIRVSSGTSWVQPLLLLVGSACLPTTPELEGGEEEEILRMRRFVLDRLSYLSIAYLSEPMHCVKLMVLEIFKRLDIGVNVFWMDVLHSMGLVTIIG